MGLCGVKIKIKFKKINKDNIFTHFKVMCMRICKSYWKTNHISKEHISLVSNADEHS